VPRTTAAYATREATERVKHAIFFLLFPPPPKRGRIWWGNLSLASQNAAECETHVFGAFLHFYLPRCVGTRLQAVLRHTSQESVRRRPRGWRPQHVDAFVSRQLYVNERAMSCGAMPEIGQLANMIPTHDHGGVGALSEQRWQALLLKIKAVCCCLSVHQVLLFWFAGGLRRFSASGGQSAGATTDWGWWVLCVASRYPDRSPSSSRSSREKDSANTFKSREIGILWCQTWGQLS